MSFSENSSDSEWKETKIKTEKIIKGEKKYYRQRFVERWLDRFKPWLARDEQDPGKPYCKACRCHLNCNKCHLQRHERTTKHHSNLQTYLSDNGMLPIKQNLGQRKERKKTVKANKSEEDDSKFESVFMDIDYLETKKTRLDESGSAQETMHDFQFIQAENDVENENEAGSMNTPHLYDTIPVPQRKRNEKTASSGKGTVKKDRQKLLLQIQKDKSELMSSFNELFSTASVEKKEKNHIDLFFESVGSSVKALSPKLVAETKMRVSQLICEMELRAITENESNAANPASSTVLLSSPLSGAYIINHQGGTPSGSNQVGSSQHDPAYEATN